jgi:ubiquinone/menaquinone biosynthesis C-methylase UbiE
MPDLYASIAETNDSVQVQLADVLELRADDQRQREMLESYLSELDLPEKTRVLEVGCGTGPVCRTLAKIPNVETVIGIDPSRVFVEKAREISKDVPGLTFRMGDGKSLDFDDKSFDLVVFHTSLCHIPTPEKALQEAHRILRPGGWLAVFDGDYVTTSVAIDDSDPLQVPVDLWIRNFVENPWLSRRLPTFLRSIGFMLESYRSHGYTKISDASYMLTIIDRGVDLLVAARTVGPDQAESLRTEAKRRVESDQFFGHISFISAIAQRTT